MQKTHPIVHGILLSAAALALTAPAVLAQMPDYLMLERCAASYEETGPGGAGSWYIQFAEVTIIDQDTGGGGWIPRQSFQYQAYAYTNGPNGIPEAGTGDDVCMGFADALDGELTWSTVAAAPNSASGIRSLTDSPSGEYGGSWDITATLNQSFDLSGVGSAELIFLHHHALRWSSSGDRGYVEVNTGSGWTAVDPYDTPFSNYYRNYLGDDHTFRRGGISLPTGSSNVQVRFRFDTDGSSSDNGWFIDDVHVVADGSILYYEDFESGTGDWTLTGSWGLSNTSYSYQTLGEIDSNGHYTVIPVTSPVSIGEGIGYGGVRAQYTEGLNSVRAFAKVYHNCPQYMLETPLGDTDDICAGIAVHEVSTPIHQRMQLWNSPNPFNPTTHIQFTLDHDADVTLRVYDEQGRLVRTLLADRALNVGQHTFTWDGKNEAGDEQASGVYFYKLTSEGMTATHRMVMLR